MLGNEVSVKTVSMAMQAPKRFPNIFPTSNYIFKSDYELSLINHQNVPDFDPFILAQVSSDMAW